MTNWQHLVLCYAPDPNLDPWLSLLNVCQVLVEAGADLLSKDSLGLTPLDLADKMGHTECMEVRVWIMQILLTHRDITVSDIEK